MAKVIGKIHSVNGSKNSPLEVYELFVNAMNEPAIPFEEEKERKDEVNNNKPVVKEEKKKKDNHDNPGTFSYDLVSFEVFLVFY